MAEVRLDRPDKESDRGTEPKTLTSEERARIKPPSMRQKIRRAFISEEINDVKSYALFDVVIPSIKRVIRDLVMNSIDMVFYGRSRASRDPRDDRETYVNYRSAYRRRDRDADDDRDSRRDGRRESKSWGVQTVGVRELDRVTFTEKEDAVDALSFLLDNLEEYHVALVSDFLSCANLETNSIHHKWGWFEIKNPEVLERPDGSGWYVRLPKPRDVS